MQFSIEKAAKKKAEEAKRKSRSPSIEFIREEQPSPSTRKGYKSFASLTEEFGNKNIMKDDIHRNNPDFPLFLIKTWETKLRREMKGKRKGCLKNIPFLGQGLFAPTPLPVPPISPKRIEIESDTPEIEFLGMNYPQEEDEIDQYEQVEEVEELLERKDFPSNLSIVQPTPIIAPVVVKPPPKKPKPRPFAHPRVKKKKVIPPAPSSGKKTRGVASATQEKSILCPECNLYFSKQGFGGHRAKFHAGQNPGYRKKQETRRKNEEKRTLLRLAQFLYFQKYTKTDIHPKDINRGLLFKLKRDIENDEKLREQLQEHDYINYLKDKRASFKRKPS